MGFRRILGFCLALTTSAAALLGGGPVQAGTQYKTSSKPFQFDITSFTTALTLPVKEQLDTIKMSDAVITQRLLRSQTDDTVEPLTVTMGTSDAQIAAIVDKLALSGKEDAFAAYLRRQLKTAKPIKPGESAKTVKLDQAGFALVDRGAFADLYSRTHHDLTIETALLKKDRATRRELMRELVPFLSRKQRKVVQNKINKGEPLQVDSDLLPSFARRMVKKFIIYRGPNCFHAALAFQSPKLTSSSLINVKRETGYHRAMINYDELWRVLGEEFYEVDPEKEPLKYGDMVVLFDVPEDLPDGAPVDFRWIRHTATYLFNGYTFSKGSKSPNTPYAVRTLAEEWRTWKRYTDNLGVKIFRRSLKTAKAHPPMDLTDWVY